jgi:hypothetical protein
VSHAIAFAEALTNGSTAPANLSELTICIARSVEPQHTILESQTRSAACMKEAQEMV